MSVTITKGDGVTVFTVASKTKSKWPLLCQMLGTLCYSPVCSLSLGLRKLQGSSQSALGAIQIMVGLLNLGLGGILENISRSWQLSYYGTPYWLGSVFLAFGFICILAERFPSPCMVGISVLMNLVGAALAITGIVLYSIDLVDEHNNRFYCGSIDYYDWTTPASVVEKDQYLEKCRDVQWIASTLLNGMEIVLIVLSVLQLCVSISSAVLGIKALCRDGAEENKSQDPELYSPLLEAVTTDATA